MYTALHHTSNCSYSVQVAAIILGVTLSVHKCLPAYLCVYVSVCLHACMCVYVCVHVCLSVCVLVTQAVLVTRNQHCFTSELTTSNDISGNLLESL